LVKSDDVGWEDSLRVFKFPSTLYILNVLILRIVNMLFRSNAGFFFLKLLKNDPKG
jgi:hypothetical protein